MVDQEVSAEKDLDLRLKRLDQWVRFIGIGGGILGAVLTAFSTMSVVQQTKLLRAQEKVSRLQVEDLAVKRHVNVKVELSREHGLTKHSIYLGVRLTNDSSREVNIAMVGIRIWKHSWKSGASVEGDPDLLVFSENAVADCRPPVCPKLTSKSRYRTVDPTTLVPGETQSDGYGPYELTPADWSQGVMIEVFVRTFEQDDGVCRITGPPTFEGAFPVFCKVSSPNLKGCDDDCVYFNAPPLPYLPAEKTTAL